MTPAAHFAEFCASLTQSEDRWEGQPFLLEPWQRWFWREALGDWRAVVLIVPRKNGKTTMLAALALYEVVYGRGRPEILLAAASDRQAGRLFDAAARTRKPGLTIARLHAAKTLLYAYEAPTTDVQDVKALKLANPATWISEAHLRRQVENPELTDAQVLQLHGCVWAASSSTWISPSEWTACANRERELVSGERVVLGFDGSFSRDSTALVAVALEHLHVWPVAVWERPDRGRQAGGCHAPKLMTL